MISEIVPYMGLNTESSRNEAFDLDDRNLVASSSRELVAKPAFVPTGKTRTLMPNQPTPTFGATWLKPTRMPVALLLLLAMLAAGLVNPSESASSPAAVAAEDTLSLSMVELLSDEAVSNPISLTALRDKITGELQRASGGDGTGVDIALIDSGVAPVAGLDGDYVLHGPDLSSEASHPEAAYLDSYGHGTHMAGIMVGRRAGHEGIAPDARVVSVKVAGHDGVTTVPQVVAAIDWVVDHRNTDGLNIRVLNLSLGQPGVTTHEGNLLSAAVERAWDAGIFVVVAAGNSGTTQPHLDAPAIDPYVMAVGAADMVADSRTKRMPPAIWTGQGDGNRNPDLAAPGVSIASYRVPGSTIDNAVPSARVGDDLFRGSGSSQAAAAVSASAARLFENNPNLTPDEMKATLENSALTRLSGVDDQLGEGIVRGGVAWQNQAYGAAEQDFDRAAGPGTGIAAPTGATWSGGTWSGATWSGATWSGATWSGATWSGGTWSGATWSGATWSGATWSGATWSGATWSGATWSGATWSGATWSGNGWV
jgi:serine protease AprX